MGNPYLGEQLAMGLSGFGQGFLKAMQDAENRRERKEEREAEKFYKDQMLSMTAAEKGFIKQNTPDGKTEYIKDPNAMNKDLVDFVQSGVLSGREPVYNEAGEQQWVVPGKVPKLKFTDDYKTDTAQMNAGKIKAAAAVEEELNPGAKARKKRLEEVQLANSIEEGNKKKKDLEKQEKEMAEGTDAQKTNAVFANRLEQAENVFDALEKAGYNRADAKEEARASVADTPLIGGAVKDSNFSKQDQAERSFVNAVLRKESGAAISPSEFESAEKQYFPRYGDDPGTLAQKRANRKTALEGLKLQSGGAFGLLKNKTEGFLPQESSGGLIAAPQAPALDPQIEGYAKQYGLDYKKAEEILRARGYGQ